MKTKDTTKVLRSSKTDLNELLHKEDDDTITFFEKHEVGGVRIIFYYRRSLVAKNIFPEHMDTYWFTSTARKD